MKFIPIDRSYDVITGNDDLETIYTIPNFPVFMGVTTEPIKNDINFPMNFQISKGTGMVQINPLVPLELVYQYSHNSGIVGKTWSEHHKSLASFIMKYNPDNVLEIGGFTGILASHCLLSNENIAWSIADPHAENNDERIKIYKTFFDENFKIDKPVGMIVHSHLLEHIIDVNKFLSCCYSNLEEDGLMILSIPNFKQFIKNRFLNCLNFEHTICLDEDFLVYLFNKYNFRIVEKEYFGESNSIFFCLKKTSVSINTELPKDVYETNKSNMLEYFRDTENFIDLINKREEKFYLFGAHVTSQFILAMGLDKNKIICILDNDSKKMNNRLYGTKLLVQSPHILELDKEPYIIVKNGSYDKEISEQILEINPKAKIFTY
jgi:hypothetical protein